MRFRKVDIDALMRGKCEWKELKIMIVNENHVHSIIQVTLDAVTLHEIERIAATMFENAKHGELSSEKNVTLGLTGQCAAAFYLFDDYRKGLESVDYEAPDLFDLDYHGYKIEVKTCSYYAEPDSWMAVPGQQFNNPRRRYPFYIACMQMERGIINILGYIDREHFEKVKADSYLPFYSVGTVRVEHLKEFAPIKCLRCAQEKNIHCEKYSLTCSVLFDALGLTWD
jgi:hypothetical protein